MSKAPDEVWDDAGALLRLVDSMATDDPARVELEDRLTELNTTQAFEPKLCRYDEFKDVFVYEIAPNRYVNLAGRDVREYGARAVLRSLGYESTVDAKRLPVMQEGRQVGTLPSDFEPWRIRSKSALYDPRPGDFTLRGDHWIASDWLGLGDLECVPGFEFSR